ncbi:hypothetical protein B0I35DRAFT_40033 [Stachybotrys elegans]|uniref:RRM domain-containing protein n=1 Tax=Stachybotrys elegans TaxID=80388 RepID=A0A8K0T4L4_9HYPO|nr:hypothetical protein B0I35DRAFT_40033 [Stachybotrys elegans]
MPSKTSRSEPTYQTSVGAGDKTGLYYITLCNLPFGTNWKSLKDFARHACSIDHVEVFENSTSAWVRVKGQDNFHKAWALLNGGTFGGRCIIASDRNKTHEIKIRAFYRSSPRLGHGRPYKNNNNNSNKRGSRAASGRAPAITPPGSDSESDTPPPYEGPAVLPMGSAASSGRATPMSTFTDPSYAVDRTEAFYPPYMGIGAYAVVLPSFPHLYPDQATRSDHHQHAPPPFAAPGWCTVPAYACYPNFHGGPGLTPPSTPRLAATPVQPYYGETHRVYITQIYHRSPVRDVVSWVYEKIADLSYHVTSLEVPYHKTTGSLFGYAVVTFADRFAAYRAIDILHLNRFVGLTVKARFEDDVEVARTAPSSYRPAMPQTYYGDAHIRYGNTAATQPAVPVAATPTPAAPSPQSTTPDAVPASDEEEQASGPVIACGSSSDKADEK